MIVIKLKRTIAKYIMEYVKEFHGCYVLTSCIITIENKKI